MASINSLSLLTALRAFLILKVTVSFSFSNFCYSHSFQA